MSISSLSIKSSYESLPLPRPKILLVDDREENLVATKRLLQSLDAEIITASNGSDALSLTMRHSFALILLDVQMPIMDGFETAQFLRENQETSRIPIIFVSAISKEEQYVFKGYGSGAVDYLFKPFIPEILLSKVKVFLELDRKRLELRRSMQTLAEINNKHQTLLECAGEGIVGFDENGAVTFANAAAMQILGWDSPKGLFVSALIKGPQASPKAWDDCEIHRACLSGERYHNNDVQLYRMDGSSFPAQVTAAPFPEEEGFSGGVLVVGDITIRKQIEEQMVKLARFDFLTGLPNRATFMDDLAGALARATRSGAIFAVVFMDLDGFKLINDTYGHGVGDLVLKVFGERLKTSIRAGDMAARLSGDEFTALLLEIPSQEIACQIAEKIIAQVSVPVEYEGGSLPISCSMGVALFPDNGQDAEALLQQADQAMYIAKKQGKNRCHCMAKANAKSPPSSTSS